MNHNDTIRTGHRIYTGDSRDMREILDESVHLVVTSPPYWQLKDYGHTNQVGFDDTYEEYINNLNLVWKECYRVLHKGCRLCINIGDQFARSVYYGRYKVIPIRVEIIRFCETLGLDYMGAIIWQKTTTTNTTGGATVMGSFPYPRNGIIKIDYEFILIFKKSGEPPQPRREDKIASKMTTEEWNRFFAGHWNFPGERQNGHLAAFPLELPTRLIRMFTFQHDTVLDPFLGSGTTALAAMRLNRSSIGFEISSSFESRIRERIADEATGLFSGDIQFVRLDRRLTGSQLEVAKEALPYRFEDKVRIEKKVDPRNLHFGSKISGREEEKGRYHSVTKVLSPQEIELDGNVKLRLIGIAVDPETSSEAMGYLLQATASQKVFVRFDHSKYDREGALLGYLYLKNKTFLNAHLLKKRLAKPDTESEYRLKARFVRLYLEGMSQLQES